ncbi:MAG: GNAT family N-acetyltransferase [Chitinophagaceae bacterium]|nr:MAG: GNAT family N-acetyltransferase [Chitinophagaceae bacterium]
MQTNTGTGWTVARGTQADLPVIMQLYDAAIDYQKRNGFIGWDRIDERFIQQDLDRGLLYVIRNEGTITVVFCICYTDELIWRERERCDALYLHRVVVHPQTRGGRLFERVLEWACVHAAEKGLRYLRMDTWADNERLIAYYEGYGFAFVERHRTGNDAALPEQHRNLNVALLERAIF